MRRHPVLLSTVALLSHVSTPLAFAQPANSNRAPNPSEQAAALAAIREYALNYTQHLPDYACTQVTQWKTSAFPVFMHPPRSGEIETQVGFADHREMEKITAVNGKPAARAEAKDLPPTSSHGEFGSLLALIFDPQTPAEFRWDRWAARDGGRMYVFSYRLPKLAGYVVQEGQRTNVVPIKGSVYADFQTKAVTRIEMQGADFPADSTYLSLELTLNYKLTRVADREFMLPSDFKPTSRQADGSTFGSAVIDNELNAQYKDYRRFSADATIQFVAADSGR